MVMLLIGALLMLAQVQSHLLLFTQFLGKSACILGISAITTARLMINDGEIIAASQEERFTRKKHDASFPCQAIQYCLKESKIAPSQIQNQSFTKNRFWSLSACLKLIWPSRQGVSTVFPILCPFGLKRSFSKTLLINELKSKLTKIPIGERLLFSEHHLSHAASAFYPSPFERAAVLTLDSVEWTTASVAVGNGRALTVKRKFISQILSGYFIQRYILYGIQGELGRI